MWTVFMKYLHVLVLISVIFIISFLGLCRQELVVVTFFKLRNANNNNYNYVAVPLEIDRDDEMLLLD